MSILICSFASQRSAPEKINRWISHLEELRSKHADDAEAVEVVERLLGRARVWIRDPERGTDAASSGSPGAA